MEYIVKKLKFHEIDQLVLDITEDPVLCGGFFGLLARQVSPNDPYFPIIAGDDLNIKIFLRKVNGMDFENITKFIDIVTFIEWFCRCLADDILDLQLINCGLQCKPQFVAWQLYGYEVMDLDWLAVYRSGKNWEEGEPRPAEREKLKRKLQGETPTPEEKREKRKEVGKHCNLKKYL
ncbi:MAG: hypothetical protein ACFFG0_34155 [Candidatus Thorarchaeota archaeon]